ncbi:hypothetical protein ASG42_17305 [Rhizobium sp. Leaf391]|nr:hypothetical protein ASG42_17305 [Rhizobium sp. Leaf391]KQS95329.1 hypothetical protein ASG50_25210 [Rhizobium sp. Leaf386]
MAKSMIARPCRTVLAGARAEDDELFTRFFPEGTWDFRVYSSAFNHMRGFSDKLIHKADVDRRCLGDIFCRWRMPALLIGPVS